VTAAVGRALTAVAPEIDATTLAPDLPLRDQVDLDSFDFLNVMVAIHDELGVDVPEADYGKLTTLDATVTYLCERLAQAAHQGPSAP
jgi:acyl carrier protein